jgi:hypothetical protein
MDRRCGEEEYNSGTALNAYGLFVDIDKNCCSNQTIYYSTTTIYVPVPMFLYLVLPRTPM